MKNSGEQLEKSFLREKRNSKNYFMKTKLKYSICYEVFTGLYHSTLLGGEFGNCHGQGKTPYESFISLKIRVNQLRRK